MARGRIGRGWKVYPANALPDWRRGGGVYALYRAGHLIYIGHTGNFHSRLVEHQRKIGFDFAKLVFLRSRLSCQKLERRLLFRLKPMANRALPMVLRPGGYILGAMR